MFSIFKPSVNLINKLRYPQKLMLLGAIVTFMVLALMYEVTEQSLTQIKIAENELNGIHITKPIIHLMRRIQEYRTIKNRVVNNLSTEDDLRTARIAVDHSMVEVGELIQDSSESLHLKERWQQINDEWDIIKLTAEEKFTYGRGSDLILNIQKLIVTTCDTTKLTTDPQIDSFYLIDSYCSTMPRFIENLENVQDLGVASLYLQNISQNDLEYLFVITTLIQRYGLPAINENIEKASTYNPTLNEKFEPILKVINQDTEKALHVVTQTVLSEKFDFPMEDYNKLFVTVKSETDQLIARTASVISGLIQQRIEKLEMSFYINLAVVIFGLLIFAYFFVGIYFSIIQSIRKLVSGTEEIAKGNLKAKVRLDTEDELSQVADSFNMMRENLKNVVSELHQVVTAVGKGNLNIRVDLTNKQGFAKELSTNINKMTDVFQDILKDIITVLDFLSKGNLTIRVTREYHGVFGELKNYVNQTTDDLEKLIKSIKNSTKTIRNAAEEISLGNNDLEKRTEQQAASLEETSVSMKKINKTVQENAENAKEAHDYVQSASNTALEGFDVVNQLVLMMNAINESAKQITDITNVIDNIAFQTNILALNAAVEAARAGEQGRGFTVVATEIRNLAQRSSVSAQGIKTLINASLEQVVKGKQLADEAGKTMQEVVLSVKNVTNTMAEIVNVSIGQATGIQQINAAITQMDLVTQQNSALVEEAARSSDALKEQTEQMNDLVNVFKISSDANKLSRDGSTKTKTKTMSEVDEIISKEYPEKKNKTKDEMKFTSKNNDKTSTENETKILPTSQTNDNAYIKKDEKVPSSLPDKDKKTSHDEQKNKDDPDEWTEF